MRTHDIAAAIDQVGRDQRSEEHALRAEEGPEHHLAVVQACAGVMRLFDVSGGDGQISVLLDRS
jgi:hypothetical protein